MWQVKFLTWWVWEAPGRSKWGCACKRKALAKDLNLEISKMWVVKTFSSLIDMNPSMHAMHVKRVKGRNSQHRKCIHTSICLYKLLWAAQPERIPANAGDRFNTWNGKIPWRRKWQPTPVFLLGKSHGQRSLASYSPWVCKRVWHDLATQTTCLYI